MICSAMRGALTLIIAISACGGLVAGLVHQVGGLEAEQPRRCRSRSAPRRRAAPRRYARDSRLPNATRDCSRRAIASSASSAAPIVRMQWWMRPGPSRPCAISKPAPFAEQQVGRRHAHVLELDLHMAVRRVVIAVDGQAPLDGDARRVHRHQDHRLLAVLGVARVGLAHQDRDLAARIARARRPPFAAVDDIIVAVAVDAHSMLVASDEATARLGHQEGRADLAAHQRARAIAPSARACRSGGALPYCRCRAPSS